MKKHQLTLVAIQEEYLSTISKQVREIVGDLIEIRETTVKKLTRELVHPGETLLLSGDFIVQLVKPFLPDGVTCIIAKRGLNFVNLKELLSLPKGRKCLVVNDTRRNTHETVEALKEIVFEHQFYPYEPDQPLPDHIDYVVTPGEEQLIPGGSPKVIDIGPRVLDLDTLLEVSKHFGLTGHSSLLVKRYMKSLVSLSQEKQTYSPAHVHAENTMEKKANYFFADVVAKSPSMVSVLNMAQKLAKTDSPVHLYGDTGTGKSMLAQAIHNGSHVRGGPYLSVNCAARSGDTLEKELFGTENDQGVSPGLFEYANGGTLCIEEVNELSASGQSRLLQIFEEKRVTRIGGSLSTPVNIRVITTSSTDLSALAKKGTFRRDLYYHLSELAINIPSLCERTEDIPFLIDHYLKQHLGKTDLTITHDAMQTLIHHSWPGNVRELYNVVSHLACLDEKTVDSSALPLNVKKEEQEKRFHHHFAQQIDEKQIIQKIEEHGFLEESLEILRIFERGKRVHTSFGRLAVKKILNERGFKLSEQQLRLRLEVLHELGLLNVRQGRSGTTISRKGEQFLKKIEAMLKA